MSMLGRRRATLHALGILAILFVHFTAVALSSASSDELFSEDSHRRRRRVLIEINATGNEEESENGSHDVDDDDDFHDVDVEGRDRGGVAAAVLSDSFLWNQRQLDLTFNSMSINLRPVIAVFSQETDTVSESSTIDPGVKKELESYDYLIPASYVNWIGQAGGRVRPVLLDQSNAYYEQIFKETNGVLFAGGNERIDPQHIYSEEAEIFYNLAKSANNRGDYYVVWGTCLGFELLSVLETGSDEVISQNVEATNLALPLDFVPGAKRTSRLFGGLDSALQKALGKENITFNSHDHGLLVSEYESNEQLNSFYRFLSQNAAPAGQAFVSSFESRDYPFYGVQWHPEKNNFEWSLNEDYFNMPHTPNAIEASQAMANFFLSEARKSSHVFPEEKRDELIYSADLIYTGKGDWFYEQAYVFHNKRLDD